MAKVTITLEDNIDGTVKFESNPTGKKMIEMHLSGTEMTGAHGLAFLCMNTILKEKLLRRKKSSPITIV